MRKPCLLHVSNALARLLWTCALASSAVPATNAVADAGAVRVSQRYGNRQITVFTDPTPLRAGPVDVSVLVQDVSTGGAVLGDSIDIEAAPREIGSATLRHRATSAAASNKLFQAAEFNLPHGDWWKFTVSVRGPHGAIAFDFELEVGEAIPTSYALWPWYCWPFLVIAIFAIIHFGPHMFGTRPSKQETL
jgi:hypothetical protein